MIIDRWRVYTKRRTDIDIEYMPLKTRLGSRSVSIAWLADVPLADFLFSILLFLDPQSFLPSEKQQRLKWT